MLAKHDDTEEGAFTRSLQGLSDYVVCWRGKSVNWMKLVVVTHLPFHRKYLKILVQIIQALIFSLAHCFRFFLIDHIFVNGG